MLKLLKLKIQTALELTRQATERRALVRHIADVAIYINPLGENQEDIHESN